MLNVYIPPSNDVNPKASGGCGPPHCGCAGRETGVGPMRVEMTFLWMSDLYISFPYIDYMGGAPSIELLDGVLIS
jgi:hypothetical protein